MEQSRKARVPSAVTSLGSRRAPLAARTGHLVGVAPDGLPLVEFEGNACGPLPARVVASSDLLLLRKAIGEQREVVLLFDGGDPSRPIVAGVLAPVALEPPLAEATLPSPPDLVEVDGRRVLIEGEDEIVLRCGEASITLRRNGRVVIRGVQVESHAEGTNRVKGADVKLG